MYTKLLTPCRLDCLCAGALLAVSTPVSAWVWRLLGAGAAGLLWLVVSRSGPNLETPAMESVGLIGTTLLSTCLVALAAGRGLFAAVCHTAVLRAFGKYSYCIYLTHWLVLDLVTWIALQEGSPIRAALPALGSNALITLSFYLVGSCSCLGVAMISWHLLEKRFLSLKRYFPSL